MLPKFSNPKNFADGGNASPSVFALTCARAPSPMTPARAFAFGDDAPKDLTKFRKPMTGNGESMRARGECVKYSWGRYAPAHSRTKESRTSSYWERKWSAIMVRDRMILR